MKICPDCQRCYEDADDACEYQEHGSLINARPGTRLIVDKYRLDRLLARGGMGAVYAGVHVELDRPIAIKLLLPNYTADPQVVERFRREARAAARIKHPNIADIYDYGTLPDGEAYIVMELVQGETLHERIKQTGQMPITDSVAIARQIGKGMEAAHGSGIIHRDLKPSNVILTQDHSGSIVVKIIDFGIAKISEQLMAGDPTLTAAGMVMGTPRYMSPEQCSGKEVDARSDIYSLGVMLYEMLAGTPPFDGTSSAAIAFKHINEPPPPLEESRRDLPPPLVALVAESLSADPSGRPQTASEFTRRLAYVGDSVNEPARRDEVAKELPVEEEVRSSLQTSEDEETLVKTPTANKATSNPPASPLDDNSPQRPSFNEVPEKAKLVVPLKSTPSTADSAVKPAAPAFTLLSDETRGRRRQPRFIFVGLAAAIAVAAIVVWAATRHSSSAPLQSQVASSPSPLVDMSSIKQSPPSPTPTLSAPSKTESKPEEKEKAEAQKPNSGEGNAATPEEASAVESEQARTEINGALNNWVAATNAGDVKKQMSLYNSTVDAFYLSRNVSRDTVRAEKQKLFDRASKVAVEASDPQIKISPDGRTATSRFRKRYQIEGEENSQGEVIQELRWVKTDTGWKIVSERDLRVIR